MAISCLGIQGIGRFRGLGTILCPAFFCCNKLVHQKSIVIYQNSVKNQIFPHILSFIGDFTFSAEVSDRVEQYKSSGLLPTYSTETSEDNIIGEYKGVKLKSSKHICKNGRSEEK